MSNNIKVAIKVRPLIAKEKRRQVEEQWTVTQNSIVSKNPLQASIYNFDHVFGKESSNRDVFEIIAHPIVRQSLEGYNGTIFAYGQTSSGKTHTMLGNDDDPGITVLAVRQLFEENESDRTFMIRVGYIEIYNEKVYDLLNERKQVTINQNGDNDVRLTNKEEFVTDGDTILNILTQGNRLRTAAQTNMNELSSRSHAIFRIIIESEDANGDGPVRVSYLNLVDLAGSEKANDAGTSGTRLKEGNDINKSLLHLGIAIRALSEGKKFVDVRSSKLTRILQASLGGNANTAIVCNITPAAVEETASTLGFAIQAKTIKNEARCNEVHTPEEAKMKQMQSEVARLKMELELSAENEKKLRAEIINKEANFLSGKDMRIVKVDRRKTWHHMSGDNHFQSLSLIPRCQINKHPLKIRSNSDTAHPSQQPNSLNTPRDIRTQPNSLNTPREFRTQSTDTPSPMQATLKYRLGRMEKEYSDLQQFTSLEAQFDLCADVIKKDGYIEKLEMELKFAREEIEGYRQSNCAKLTNGINTSNSNGMIEPETNGVGTDSSAIVSELQAEKDKNNELMQQLADLESAHENYKKNVDTKLKIAKDAREKAEILQAEGEITFEQYKKQTNRRINELISEVESLKVHSSAKPVDLNISKMPIKVEPESSYELGEVKFELDQLKHDRERQKKKIDVLEANLKSITDERNAIKSEHAESSARHSKTISELESQLKELAESQPETLQLNRKIVEDLEVQVKTVTAEKNVLQSEHSDSSARNNKIIEDLKSQLNTLHSKQSEVSSSHAKTLKDLETQLETMWAERNVLTDKKTQNSKIIDDLQSQVKIVTEERTSLQSELSASNSNIRDLETRLQTITEEKKVLESENSDLSTQIMDYIEELDELKSKLDSMGNLQSKFDDLQKIYEDNLQVIEKTEEECRAFKASLLESYDKIKISMDETELLKRKNSSLSVEVSTLKNVVHTQSVELDDLKRKMEELQLQKEMLGSEKKDDQVEILQKKHREDVAEMEQFYKKLTEQQMADAKKLQTTIAQLQSELQEKQQQLINYEADISNLRLELSGLKAKTQKEQQQLQKTIDQLQSELNSKEKQWCELQSDLKMDLQEKQQQLINYEADISNLRPELSGLKAKTQKEQQQLQKTIDQLQSELNSKEKQWCELQSDLKMDLQEKQQQLINYEADISNLRPELSELKAKTQKEQQQLQKTIDQLQSELNSKEKQWCELQSDLKMDLQEKQQQLINYEADISNFRSELSGLKAKTQKEQQQLQKTIDQLQSELNSKEKQWCELQSDLKMDLQEKQQQLINYEADISNLRSELSGLKAKTQKEQQQLQETIDQLQSELNSKEKQWCELQSDLKMDLQEKQQQLTNYEADISELRSELLESKEKVQQKEQQLQYAVDQQQSELKNKGRQSEAAQSDLEMELQEKRQLIDNYETIINELQSEILEFKAKVQPNQHQQEEQLQPELNIDDRQAGESKSDLKMELQEKQQLIDNYETVINELQSEILEVKSKLQLQPQQSQEKLQDSRLKLELKKQSSDLKSLKLELQEKQQQIINSVSKISDLELELKATLQLNQQQAVSNDEIIARLQSEVNEKMKNELTAKQVIETLENRLRSHDPEAQKPNSPKSAKINANADRKARRYSQHDESRLWLDDTVEPPRSIETQTDPTDENCSCESMNLKIAELKNTVAIKTAVVNTQRLQMENHPLISKNKDLKKDLDDMKAEAELLRGEVDQCKAKLQRAKMSLECDCRNRMMQSKEVQVNGSTDPEVAAAAIDQNDVANGQSTAVHPNIYDLDPNLQIYYYKSVPSKYREANLKIQKLEKVNKEITKVNEEIKKKSNIYKELALSRRATVKELEAKLAEKKKAPESSNSASAPESE